MLTLAFAPVTRAMPGVRLGPAGEAACRPPASRGDGAEGTACVPPVRSVSCRRFRDHEIHYAELDRAQLLLHARRMRCRLRFDGRKKILVVSNSFEQVRLERAQVAEVLDRQSDNAVSDRVLQVVHVEGQL